MKTKKILSLLVAMTMLLSCVGITAMAEETAPIVVTFTDGYTMNFDSLSQAMRYGYSGGDIEKITVYEDITETITYLKGNIVSGNPDGVTITNTITEADGYYIYCDSTNFTIGEGVTFNAPTGGLFVYGNDCVINGRVTVATYYQRYSGTKLTINEPGNLTVTGDGTILRYMDSDPNAGIYINGDNNDETVGLNAAVIYFYQGMINAKDANIKVGTYWQTNETDNVGSANLVLDNTKMSVTVNEHNFEATGNSTVTLTNNSKLTIAGGHQFGESAVVAADATSSIADKNGNIEVASPVTYVAQVGGTKYETLEAALEALTSGATLTLLDNVTITGPWDERYTGARIKVPATIDGNGKTITFACDVADGNNYHSAFRVEANGTVEFKNLTIDMSSATNSANTNMIRAISSKGADLIVDNCKFIGNSSLTNTRAIIFGEGAQHSPETDVTVSNSIFTNWKQGVTDNENAKDVGTVTITGNTFTNAGVNVSASKSVTFTGNTVSGAYVTITAYSSPTDMTVTATGNTLQANTGTTATTSNRILVGTTINAQDEFVVPAKGSNSYAYTGEVDGYVRVWGEGGGNAKESFVLKLYSEDTLMATTQLNNIGGIIDGDVYVTWTFFYPESNDPYWTTTWEEGHPNKLAKPTKVELYIDGTLVSTTAAQMNGPDNLNPVIWENLGGVQAPELPTATVGEVPAEKLVDAPNLTFSKRFVAADPTDEQEQYYGKWFADFELTVNKDVTFNADSTTSDGYLAGSYDWYQNGAWISVPFADVELEAGQTVKIMSYAAELMGQPGLKLTYNDVLLLVKTFDCGVFFTEKFLAANPDLEVTLELRMYNPKDESESYVIGETYTFEAPEVETPVAAIGEKKYSTLQEALADAKEGDTITLLGDVYESVTIDEGKNIVLDLAGFDIVGEMYAVKNNGTLTINDSVGTGNVYTTNVEAQGRPAVENRGTITINGGWFGDSNNDTTDRNAINRGNAIKNYGVAIINGGYFTNVSNQYISNEAYAYAINTLSGGTTTINDAVIYGDINGLIYSEGKTIVNDGSFTLGRPNEENNLWYLAYGDVEIKGGTWTRAFKVPSWNTGNPTVTGDVKISGGRFNVDIADTYIVEGYEAVQLESGIWSIQEKAPVAKIGETTYATFEDALNAVQNGETITLLDVTGDESKTEIEFTKDIEFTITGVAPNYALPVVTFQNTTVTIKDAEILIPELDARQNATINVVDSTVHDVGVNSIVKSYYNGTINISGTSVVFTMQATTMGYITISDTAKLNATWQTNVYGNGMITVEDTATFATGALHLTGKDYSGRDNTEAERVGKPATIVVDGATLTVGKVYSDSGADYSYNSSHGINIGTIDGKSAVLDIKNDATVNIYMANGQTANIGANGTVNVEGSALNVACRKEDGTVNLANEGVISVNNGTINLTTVNATITTPEDTLEVKSTVDGYEVDYADGKYSLKEIEEAKLFEFGVTSVTLGNSLTVNFYVDAENIVSDDYFAVIKHFDENGTKEETVPFSNWETRTTADVVTSYVIPYKNLAARQMTDKIEVTICNADGTPASVTKTDSLREYALRGINTYAGKSDLTDKQKNVLTALVDMLNYGAVAQLQFDYREEELADADTDAFQIYATSDISDVQNIQEKDDNYSTTTLVLKNNIVLTAYFKNVTEGMYAVYKFTDHYGNEKSKRVDYDDFVVNRKYGHGVDVDELVIADAGQPVNITMYNANGTVYSTLIDSMNSYLRRAMNVMGEDSVYGKIAKFTKAAYRTLH